METTLRRILHPTDFSRGSHTAFLHALKIALAVRGKLTLLHVKREGEEVEWSEFPGVRTTLSQWGLLPAGAHHEDVAALGLAVRKVIAKDTDPVKACLAHLHGHPADLIVLATSQQQGRSRWLAREVSEPLAREAGVPTLLVPNGASGFVREADGALALERVLFPVASEPRPDQAAGFVAEVLGALGFSGTVDLFHVGDRANMPAFDPPGANGMHWSLRAEPGDVVDAIVGAARTCGLVAMPTQGHHGFLDAFRGSTTERVLREVACPVLALPA